MVQQSTSPRAFYAGGGERRRYLRDAHAKGDDRVVPAPADLARRLDRCPGAILDTAPGGGLGVWVLVEEDLNEGTCTYEYGGGIA